MWSFHLHLERENLLIHCSRFNHFSFLFLSLSLPFSFMSSLTSWWIRRVEKGRLREILIRHSIKKWNRWVGWTWKECWMWVKGWESSSLPGHRTVTWSWRWFRAEFRSLKFYHMIQERREEKKRREGKERREEKERDLEKNLRRREKFYWSEDYVIWISNPIVYFNGWSNPTESTFLSLCFELNEKVFSFLRILIGLILLILSIHSLINPFKTKSFFTPPHLC